jgi:hypothetical protein
MADTEHQCPYCELRFSYLAEVKDHVSRDHPSHAHVVDALDPHELPHHSARGAAAPAAIDLDHVHQCPWCELRFARTSELGDHVALDHTRPASARAT